MTKTPTTASPTNSPSPAGRPGRWADLRPRRGLLVATVLVVAVIDQITKLLAVDALEGRAPVNVIGEFFQLTLIRNPGAAFSMGTDSTWLFTTIQIAFIIAVAVASKWLRTPLPAIAAGLVAGGAAGNLIDRLFRAPSFYFGHVVDFLSVRGFAVFNVADSAITVGAIALAAWIIFSRDVDEMTGEKADEMADTKADEMAGEEKEKKEGGVDA